MSVLRPELAPAVRGKGSPDGLYNKRLGPDASPQEKPKSRFCEVATTPKQAPQPLEFPPVTSRAPSSVEAPKEPARRCSNIDIKLLIALQSAAIKAATRAKKVAQPGPKAKSDSHLLSLTWNPQQQHKPTTTRFLSSKVLRIADMPVAVSTKSSSETVASNCGCYESLPGWRADVSPIATVRRAGCFSVKKDVADWTKMSENISRILGKSGSQKSILPQTQGMIMMRPAPLPTRLEIYKTRLARPKYLKLKTVTKERTPRHPLLHLNAE